MNNRSDVLDAAVVGAGWAGVSVSRALQKAGLSHVVFERRRICEIWRTQRWNAFHMNTPNVLTVMPGDRYQGDDPEGYMTRDAFVEMVEDYVRRHALPIETGVAVAEVRPNDVVFDVTTPRGVTRARNLVVASGNLNVARRPAFAAGLPPDILQIDGSDYRDSAALPDGAALVVGCGNSGGQIAEDIVRSGRSVYLATGRNGRVPRRYRNRDIILWLAETGRLGKPRASSGGRPLLGATHTISLQSLSAQGVVMLGRLTGHSGNGVLSFADDLGDSAAFGDQVARDIKLEIDAHIAAAGVSAPDAVDDPAETCAPRFPDPPILELDLRAHGVTIVIWSIGFVGDFSWLKIPAALDERGAPAQRDCVSVPGVYFAGLDSDSSLEAGTVMVAEEEAERIVGHMIARGG